MLSYFIYYVLQFIIVIYILVIYCYSCLKISFSMYLVKIKYLNGKNINN